MSPRDSATTIEEKRLALDAVLRSRTLSRSDRLKALLRFICEAEIEERGHELNEYTIGVEALGRPEGYATSEDASVRSRIYELRQKLERYYSAEAPDAAVRIELVKGSHNPRFVRNDHLSGLVARRSGFERWGLALLCLGILGGALATFLVLTLNLGWRPLQRTADWTPELESIWAPILDSGTPVLISFETRLFLRIGPVIVRDGGVNEMSQIGYSEPLSRIRQLFNVPEVYEARNLTDFGAAYAVFLLSSQLRVRKPNIRLILKRSVDLTWGDIRNNHLIFLGKPNTDPQIMHFLERSEFVDGGNRIRVVHPRQGEASEYIEKSNPIAPSNWAEKYAVITMIPGIEPGKRILILAASGSEYPWALASYVTTPASARELVEHLRLPSGRLPESYQVVIRAQFIGKEPTKVEYVTHKVLVLSRPKGQ